MGWEDVGGVVGGILGNAILGPGGVSIGERGSPSYALPSSPTGSGAAADAAERHGLDISAAIDELTELDAKAADAVAAIEAAGAAGNTALAEIIEAVDAKIAELGPRLETPAGQQELRDFLKQKLTAAQRILEEQNQIALDRTRELQEIAERFGQVGQGPPSTGADPSGTAQTTPANAPTGMPPMPPAGMIPPIPAAPSVGGGVPAGGIGEPLSALGGLGAQAPSVGQPVDRAPSSDDSEGDPTAPDDGDQSDPPASGTEVELPDGTTVQAPTEQIATAMRSALGGASVSDAYQQAGIILPPPGTPVPNPVLSLDVQPGDVGVSTDHLAMALGEGKVLSSGQVQPQSGLEAAPGFLGWVRPVDDDSGPDAPAPTRPAGPLS